MARTLPRRSSRRYLAITALVLRRANEMGTVAAPCIQLVVLQSLTTKTRSENLVMYRPGCALVVATVVQLLISAAGVAAEPDAVVTLTKKAAEQVTKVIREQNLAPDTLLRVGVSESNGEFQHTLGFAKKSEKTADDLEFESAGIRIIVDKKSSVYLLGTKIDFEEQPKPGFRFDNPNAVKDNL
jgi:iron-sulfur cluster assembly protein